MLTGIAAKSGRTVEIAGAVHYQFPGRTRPGGFSLECIKYRLGPVRSDLEDVSKTVSAQLRHAVQIARLVHDEAAQRFVALSAIGEGMEHDLRSVRRDLENDATTTGQNAFRTIRVAAVCGRPVQITRTIDDQHRFRVHAVFSGK